MRTGPLICIFLVFSFASQPAHSKTWVAKVLQKGIKGMKHIKNVSGGKRTVAEAVQETALAGGRKTLLVDKVADDLLQPSLINKVNPKNILKVDDAIEVKVIDKVISKGQNVDATDIKKIGTSVDDIKISYNSKPDVIDATDIKKIGTSVDDIKISYNSKPGVVGSKSKPGITNKVDTVPETDLVSGPKLSLLDKAKKQITPDLMTNGLVQPSVVKKVNPKEIIKDVVINKANPVKDGTLASGTKIDMTKLKELGKTHKIQQIDPKYVMREEATLPKDVVGRHSHRWFDKFYGGRTKDGVALSNNMGNAKIKPQNGVPNKNIKTNAGSPEAPNGARGIAVSDEIANKGKKVSGSISKSNDGGANSAKAGIQADQSVPKYSDMRNKGVAIDQADYANKKNVLLTSGVTVGQATYPWLSTTITAWGKQLKEHIEEALPWFISAGVILGSLILVSFVLMIKNQCCCCCERRKSAPNVNAGKLEITLKGLPSGSTTLDKKDDKMIPVPKTLIKKEETSLMRGKSNKQLVEFYSNYTIDRPSTPKCMTGIKTTELMI